MTWPTSGLRDIEVSMYCDSTADSLGPVWRDISDDVLHENRIEMSLGRPDAFSDYPPNSCSFTLKDPDGDYSPKNPMGQYNGFLKKSTVMRVNVKTAREDFEMTVANGWGNATSGQAWTLSGTAADFDKGSGVGTVVVPAAGNDRIAYMATELHADIDLKVTFSLAVASITGGGLTAGGLILRGVSLTDFLYAKVEIQTSGAIWISIVEDDDTIISNVVVSGLTYAAGTEYSVRFVVVERAVYARVWATAAGEPVNWTVTEYLGDFGFGKAYKYGGFVGLRTKRSAGNTNNNVVVTYKNFEVNSNRYFGEVKSLTPFHDVSAQAHRVAVVLAGRSSRWQQGEEPLQSALRRAIPGAANLIQYWPMEDGTAADAFSSAIAGAPSLEMVSDTRPNPASNSDLVASAPLPVMADGYLSGWLPDYDATVTGSFQARCFIKFPAGVVPNSTVVFRFWSQDGTARLWQVVYGTGGDLSLEAYDNGIVNIFNSGTIDFNSDDQMMRLSVELDQVGANIDWRISIFAITSTVVATLSGTLNSYTIGQIDFVSINPGQLISGGTTLDGTVIGHFTAQDTISSLGDFGLEQRAYLGEEAATRFARLCNENGISNTRFGNIDSQHDTAAMGQQKVNTLTELLRECVNADMGSMYESRAVGFENGSIVEYRSRVQTYDQDPMLTLDVSAGQVAVPWNYTDDDQQARNDVTAKRIDGGSYRVQKLEGPNSILDSIDGGIGQYKTDYPVSLGADLQLPDVASWQVELGTVDGYRFPSVTVNLGNSNITSVEANAAMDVFVDDMLRITNADASRIYDDIDLLARGYHESLSSDHHVIEFNCSPAKPYQVGILDESGDGAARWDSGSTVTNASITSSATSMVIYSTEESWTTAAGDLPIPIMVGGEEMLVTAITAATPTFGAVGTAAHGNNASVTPGVPAGLAVGDPLFLLSAIRNSGTGTPNTPAGWELLVNASNVCLYGKPAEAADLIAMPTVSFTGGVANATTSAQAGFFRGVAFVSPYTNAWLNGAAQNMAYVPPNTPYGAPVLVIMFSWKQDDWTSVATLSGGTEISEFFSTTGDDQGLVWDYFVFNGFNASIQPGSFTVTGGTSQISRGGVAVMYATQTMTVTRSVNGVVMAHPARAEVHVKRPFTLAL